MSSKPPAVNDTAPIDLVFVDFPRIRREILQALKTIVGKDYTESVKSYTDVTSDKILGMYAKHAWQSQWWSMICRISLQRAMTLHRYTIHPLMMIFDFRMACTHEHVGLQIGVQVAADTSKVSEMTMNPLRLIAWGVAFLWYILTL